MGEGGTTPFSYDSINAHFIALGLVWIAAMALIGTCLWFYKSKRLPDQRRYNQVLVGATITTTALAIMMVNGYRILLPVIRDTQLLLALPSLAALVLIWGLIEHHQQKPSRRRELTVNFAALGLLLAIAGAWLSHRLGAAYLLNIF